MAAPRRSESDSDYEEADTGQIQTTEINNLRKQLTEKYTAASGYLLSSKEPIDKRRMIDATLQEFLAAFNHIAAAYDRLNSSSQVLNSVKGVLKKTIRDEVSAAVSKALPPSSLPNLHQSYATAASRLSKPDSHRVKVSNGPTVVIPNTVSFVIGPKASHAKEFVSADDTRKAVMRAVKPGDVSLKVSKILNTRNNSVRIIADDADVDKLRSSPTLSAAGLEVKIREKLNPRMVIRGVPVDISSTDLVDDIICMNTGVKCIAENIKIVYRYPPRDNKTLSSVVVETSSDVRRELLRQGRVYLSWQSCKIEDHLKILQCYKCQGFGHQAKNCSLDPICGHCSGPHSTSTCSKTKTAATCHNCVVAKLDKSDHRAFDAQKCPLIKQRLTEKAKNICY